MLWARVRRRTPSWGLPGSKERVNYNKNIGIYIDPVTGNQTPTTMGIIHYSKNGYHVVPAKPKE